MIEAANCCFELVSGQGQPRLPEKSSYPCLPDLEAAGWSRQRCRRWKNLIDDCWRVAVALIESGFRQVSAGLGGNTELRFRPPLVLSHDFKKESDGRLDPMSSYNLRAVYFTTRLVGACSDIGVVTFCRPAPFIIAV
jgi:hypothetical protein